MAAATVKVDVRVTGLPSGSVTIDIPLITLATAIAERKSLLTLVSGDNTFLKPDGTGGSSLAAKGIIFIPPVANAVAFTLKRVTGDTGFAMDPAQPLMAFFAAGVTQVVINAAGTIANCELIWL